MIRTWGVNLLLVAALAVAGTYTYTQTSEAERALCALRLNLEVRVADSEKYLADVRAGKREPVRGITEADIRTSIRNQRQTIDALSELDCR